MTPLRALFFLAAVTAACAATIPAKVQDADSLETHIALLAHHRFTANPIESGIDKIKELVRRIEERIKEAESELLDALQATSTAVVKKVNDFILSKTGINLQLDKKLEAFEKKAEGCNAQFKKSLKDVVDEIKTETESCAAAEVAAVKEISEKIVALVDILKVVPPQTISKIKACSAAPAPDAPTPAPQAPTPVPEALRGVHSVGSWSDLWREAKCVTKVLADASKELVEVPDAIEKVVSDIAALSGKDTREAVKKCAEQSIAGKPEVVQEAAAQLAYCVIAPSKQ